MPASPANNGVFFEADGADTSKLAAIHVTNGTGDVRTLTPAASTATAPEWATEDW
jgi:hypothetical protein